MSRLESVATDERSGRRHLHVRPWNVRPGDLTTMIEAAGQGRCLYRVTQLPSRLRGPISGQTCYDLAMVRVRSLGDPSFYWPELSSCVYYSDSRVEVWR